MLPLGRFLFYHRHKRGIIASTIAFLDTLECWRTLLYCFVGSPSMCADGGKSGFMSPVTLFYSSFCFSWPEYAWESLIALRGILTLRSLRHSLRRYYTIGKSLRNRASDLQLSTRVQVVQGHYGQPTWERSILILVHFSARLEVYCKGATYKPLLPNTTSFLRGLQGHLVHIRPLENRFHEHHSEHDPNTHQDQNQHEFPHYSYGSLTIREMISYCAI